MIKQTNKYIYSLIAITTLINSNKIYAQELLDINDTVTLQNSISNPIIAKKIDSQILVSENAVDIVEDEEIDDYLKHKEALKNEITECLSLLSSSKEGSSLGEYPAEAKNNFKLSIAKAEQSANKTEENSDIYIDALEMLQNAKTLFQSSMIDNKQIEEYSNKIAIILDDISKTIKDTEVGVVNGGVTENQKIALSVIYSEINTMIKDTNDIDIYKKAIKLGEYALSDFNDNTISITDDGIVNGRKLTGVISKQNATSTNITIVSKDEFIPQAGFPIDIKMLLNTTGIMLIGVSGIIYKKEKK